MENTESTPRAKALPFWKEAAISCAVPMALVTVFVLWGGIATGRPMVEKMLKGFALPCGLIWLTMLMMATWCFIRKQPILAILATCLFAVHGLIGGEIFPVWLCDRLEAPYEFVNPPAAEHFDLVVVLGGGTKSGGPQHAGFSTAGDRIGLAVRLFHAGKTDKLVFTGSNMPWENRMLSPSESATRLAMELNVPESVIEIAPGHNTYKEFQFLVKSYGDAPETRIGLLTSATHMSRAMRLADSVGLPMVPIPADFERRAEPPTLLSVIPSAAGYRMTERCCAEFLAWLVGR